jgi:hypothetical protein
MSKKTKQKGSTDPIEIGDIIECNNRIGEVVSFLSDRRKSAEYIVLDKRLEPLVNLQGEFKYKKSPLESVKHFDYSKLRGGKTFILGDIIKKEYFSDKPKYGILVGFTHPDGILSSSYEHGYNGVDYLECIEISKKDLHRKVNKDGEVKRFQTTKHRSKICAVDYFTKKGAKIIDE